MDKAILEGFKEIVRTSILAVLPLVIEGLSSNQVSWKGILVAFAIAVLSGIDKYLHKSDNDINGLIPKSPIT